MIQLHEAKTFLAIKLQSMMEALAVDFAINEKSPNRVLVEFQNALLMTESSIVFRCKCRDLANRLIGLSRDERLSHQSRSGLEDCRSACQMVVKDLNASVPFDLLRLRFSSLMTESKSSIDLGQDQAEVIKTIIGEVADEWKFKPEWFKSNQSVGLGDPTKQPRENVFRLFLENLSIAPGSLVFEWHDPWVTLTQWREILGRFDQDRQTWFNDEYILAADGSWMLLFFHHDVIYFGEFRELFTERP